NTNKHKSFHINDLNEATMKPNRCIMFEDESITHWKPNISYKETIQSAMLLMSPLLQLLLSFFKAETQHAVKNSETY
ncbi:hypothetical protein, partial [Klebsiella pneumoniae]|uniref:hypothetical protein n=1 Tax=Klebsiella pneumoniae TaxID=573 RepID=UPI0039C0E5F5